MAPIASLSGSHSAPNIKSMASTKASLRGNDDIVVGSCGTPPLYVPRAPWTESLDSPMKCQNRAFDTKQFCADELTKQRRQEGMKTLIKHHLDDHVAANETFRRTELLQKQSQLDLLQANTNKWTEVDSSTEKKQQIQNMFRDGLDKQVSERAQRLQDSRLREQVFDAETKRRTLQELTADLNAREAKKQQAKADVTDQLREFEARRPNKQALQKCEAEELRNSIIMQALDAEKKQQAQNNRLNAATPQLEWRSANAASYFGDQRQRRENEFARHARDEQMHVDRMDAHYARRDAARLRQQQRVSLTLKDQVFEKQTRKEFDELQKQAELNAVREAQRSLFEEDLAKAQKKTADRLYLHRTLTEQIASNSQSGAAATTSNISKISGKPSSSPTAGQLLASSNSAGKQPGLVEDKPRAAFYRTGGLGGVTGVFQSEGSIGPALAATKASNHLLTKHSSKAKQGWSNGLSSFDIRNGQQMAAKRAAANAADKSLAA